MGIKRESNFLLRYYGRKDFNRFLGNAMPLNRIDIKKKAKDCSIQYGYNSRKL